MEAIAREPSSGLSSPGPDSDIERAGDGSRPATANGSTPLRFIAPIDGSRKNKESPSPEDDDGQPAKKKRHRRTRADLEADRKAAELYPELYTKGKNPHPYDPRMPRPPLPGESGYQPGMPAAKVKQMMLDAVAAGIASPVPSHMAAAAAEAASVSSAAAAAAVAASRSPPIVMSPYAATLAPDSHRRESAPAAPLHDLSQSRNGNGNRDSHHNSPIVPSEKLHSSTTAMSQSANPSPRSTHYDPIRGLMSNSSEAPRSNPVTAAASPSLRMASTASVAATNGAAMLNRASASPAISSLVDPPPVSHISRPILSHHNSTPNSNNANSASDTIIISSPTRQHLPSSAEYPSRTISAPLIEASKPTTVVAAVAAVPAVAATAAATATATASAAAPPQTQTLAPRESLADTAMDLDPTNAATKPHSSRASISSGASPHSGPAKPKEKREKPPLPPLPGSGSGLLTSAMLGVAGAGPGATGGDDHKPAPVVCIEVKLEAGGNNIINFGRMAEQKYGFSALHPRLAAQKERLARVAAAGAMLENEARARAKGLDPDAMSEDLDGGSDEEKNAESNAEAGGASTAEAPKRKKRNFKEDNYDKADPFVDDSELGLEEQAALATDGFFVYCGPLVEEGRMPVIQGRPDGTAATTGRGRGRGRGRGGGPGSRGGKVPGVEGSGTGRGGGPGSRGGRGRGRGRGRGGANNASPANRGDAPQQRQPYSDLSNYIRQYQPELEHGTPSKTAATAAGSNQTNGYHGNAGGSAPSAIVVE